MMPRWFTRPVVATLALLVLVLATPAVSAQTPTSGGTLTVGFSADTKTLDPTFSVQFSERQVLYLVFNALVRYGTDFSLQPDLAQSWEIKNDGKQIVFKLRSGVKFHDGTPFDANAVKWNIEHRLDPATASPQRQLLEPIIDNVQVIDPTTVAFNLKQPSPGLLGLLGERPGFMVSPAAAQKYGKEFGSNPVGTGPFVFKEWVRGSHIAVEKNPAYWEAGKPYLDRVDVPGYLGRRGRRSAVDHRRAGLRRRIVSNFDRSPARPTRTEAHSDHRRALVLAPVADGQTAVRQCQAPSSRGARHRPQAPQRHRHGGPGKRVRWAHTSRPVVVRRSPSSPTPTIPKRPRHC